MQRHAQPEAHLDRLLGEDPLGSLVGPDEALAGTQGDHLGQRQLGQGDDVGAVHVHGHNFARCSS
jgi:hypothetical protein